MAFDNETGKSLDALNPQIPVTVGVDYSAFGLLGSIGETGKSLQSVTPQTPNLFGDVAQQVSQPLDFPQTFFNTFQTYTASCPPNFTGTPVTKVAGPGSYASRVSVAAANSQALNDIQVQAQAALSCTPVPQLNTTYVSATGNFGATGYIDGRYFITGQETGVKATAASMAIWNIATNYDIATFHRVFYNGKFYQSLTDNNVGHQPDISPGNWSEVEAAVHYLSQFLSGSQWECYFAGSGPTCTPCGDPGCYAQRGSTGGGTIDGDYSGKSTVDHATGIETWNGAKQTYNASPIFPFQGFCPNRGTISTLVTNQATILASVYGAVGQGGYRQNVFSSEIQFQSHGTCGSERILSNTVSRGFTDPEDAAAYLTPSGTSSSSNSGVWTNAWTATGVRTSIATIQITNALPLHSYGLVVTYTSGGPVPPPSQIAFTTDQFGAGTVVCSIPFGGGGNQTVSILSASLIP